MVPVAFAEPSPTAPVHAAFYYPWFPETWHDNDHYDPSLGRYRSDATVAGTHFSMMRYAGLDTAITSWWGAGTPTGNRFRLLAEVADAQGFTVTPYYEKEYGSAATDPSTATVAADLEWFSSLYAEQSGGLRVGADSKPVIFVYNAGDTGCADVTRWKAAEARWAAATIGPFHDFYVSMKVFPGYEQCPDQPEAWHQYGPASARTTHGAYHANISPGFWHHDEAAPRLARDRARWQSDAAWLAAQPVAWRLVTSFNEWGEGTSVEPAAQWESPSGFGTYLDDLRAALTGGGTSSPTPTVGPTPTPTPTTPVGGTFTAVEDATVRSDVPDEVNNGSTLNVDGSPTRRSYVKFQLPDGVAASGTLRVWAKSSHATGFSVRSSSSSWSEGSRTYANSPAPGSELGVAGGFRSGSWVEVPVAGLSAGAFSVALVDRGSGTNMSLASSEDVNPPQLVVAGSSSGPSPTPTPSPTSSPTAPPVGDELVVWAAGDLCDDDFQVPGCREVGNVIRADAQADRFLALGDIAYESGTAAQFATYYDPHLGHGALFADGRSIWDLTYTAIGNHEYLTSGAAPYFAYFGADRAGTPGSGSYFMRDLGRWRILSVNTNCGQAGGCGATSAQATWLRNALQAATAAGDHTIVIGHHPPYSDGASYSPGVSEVRPLFTIAVDNGADAWLAGHDHQYQRWGALGSGGTRVAGGLPFWVVGTGGKGNTGLDSSQDSLFLHGGSGTLPGALRLTLGDAGLSYRFTTTDGAVLDSGSESVR